VAGPGVAAQAGAAEQRLAAAHKALVETKGLQFDFSAYQPPPTPPWVEVLLRVLEAIAPILKYVFWGGLIVGLAMIAWFVIREFMGVRLERGGRTDFKATGWRPEPARAQALLEEADRLAAEGRFDEAVHVLLFRSIDDIAGRRPGLVRPALTSRDIARLEAMPGDARSAFERIAEAVERSFFGGRAVGPDEFGRARADYQAFAFSEGWR
jgi:hypothetical protein